MSVIYKTKEEVEIMKEGGQILASILGDLKKNVRPGIPTQDLDDLASSLMEVYKVEPSFLGYNNFPASLCVSINDEVVHGVPSERIIEEGDIVSVDCGIRHRGFHVDSAFTIIAGVPKDDKHRKMIMVARSALERGIAAAKPGNTTGDIGFEIERFVKSEGFNLIEDLIGHGVGQSLHEDPEVPNYGDRGTGVRLEPGMVFAIEPMVTEHSTLTKLGPDGFAYVTRRGDVAVHCEKTIAITEKGNLILTPTDLS